MTFKRFFWLVLLQGVFISQMSQAAEMAQRLGVGVKADPVAPAAIVLHYYQSQQFSWFGSLGINGDNGSHLSVAWRYHWWQSPQAHAFWALQVRHMVVENHMRQDSLGVGGLFGVEYFVHPDFSLHWDAGFEIVSENRRTLWRTTGSPLTQIALTFYW